jgi:hypothetical protein
MHRRVGVADEHPQPVIPLTPCPVQAVQDRVGEHGRERTALGSALLGMREHRALQHPSPKDCPNKLQDPPVTDPLPHTVEHQVKPEPVEEAFDVGVHHPGPPAPHRLADRLQGLVRAALGPKPKRAGQKVGFQDRLEHDPQGRLDHPVANTRDPERAKPWRLGCARFGDPDPPHRLRTVGPLPQRRCQVVEEPSTPAASTSAMVMASAPGAPRLARTSSHARRSTSPRWTRSYRAWNRRPGDRLAAR